MASITAPTRNPHKLNFHNPKPYPSSVPKRPSYPSSPSSQPPHSRFPDSSVCRCQNPSSSSSSSESIQWRWDSALQDLIKTTIKGFDSYVNFKPQQDAQNAPFHTDKRDDPDWNWDRWRQHFLEVEEQERLLSLLKSQLGRAVNIEDFDDAAKLKVAIAAASTNDAVGTVISHLNKAIQEERYQDAAFFRDDAGAGLVGWWAGLSEDKKDTRGLIIRVTAEHGRYVARSYSPRQLATAAAGVPLFEIYVTTNKVGEYKQQAVYLKLGGVFQDSPQASLDSASTFNPLDSAGEKGDLFVASSEDAEDGDDGDDGSDLSEGLSSFQSILRDMIPNVKVKVLKVTSPGKVDRDLISKVIEQIIEEQDEDKDNEIESLEAGDEEKVEGDEETDVIELDGDSEIIQSADRREISVRVVVGGLGEKISSLPPTKNLLRVPAKLEKKGRLSFSFSVENDVKQQDSRGKEPSSADKKAILRGQRSIDNVMFDLAKFMGKEKIPLKVLKDVGELINLALSHVNNHQPLSGQTTFNRIEMPASPDPLSGLYIGAHGHYTSEVIHLRRKFGQWKEDGGTQEPSDLEFYEYVEALKLTGDPFVPAGQVAFRAKVGKRYQLPHKGIIPEEFGVVARYKGQGRLADPGFRNPRWVDGELVILDGKYIKGGPVVGFVYWAPEYHFLVFFNRLRLQE